MFRIQQNKYLPVLKTALVGNTNALVYFICSLNPRDLLISGIRVEILISEDVLDFIDSIFRETMNSSYCWFGFYSELV